MHILIFSRPETMLQIGPEEAWLWAAVEPIHIQIFRVTSQDIYDVSELGIFY